MDNTSINTAVVFADIVDSTGLYKRFGDKKANEAVSRCVAMMAREVESHQGIVVKTIGDEVMSRFETADLACAAAIAIQKDSHKDSRGLDIRVGAAFGSAILKDNDVFGKVVNEAAAIARVARAKQILISQRFAYEVGDFNEDFAVHPFDEVVMKGDRHTTVIHRVDWESQDITVNSTQVLELGARQNLLAVPHIDLTLVSPNGGKTGISVLPGATPFVVGRDENACSLGVPTTFASRDHFHILHRRGNFILVDNSTNGTYVQEDGAEAVYLRREEMVLRGSGVISMGRVPDNSGHLIQYQCATPKPVAVAVESAAR